MRTKLKTDEKLLLIIRRHWIKLVPAFAAWLLLAIALIWWLHNGVAFLIVLVAALYPAWEYIGWKYNLWAVTNMRVVDESGAFTRYSKESPLDKINNVEYDQDVWGRILGYGDVDIQTAAELGETSYTLIHHPKLLKDTITHAQEEYKRNQISSQATQLAQAIAKQTGSTNVPGNIPPQLVADELQKLFDLLQKGAITNEEYLLQKNKLLGNN
ncbi:MAG: PH domain-containing protein [Bacteroidetes bacterium]|nr:PH domain-containing protein [Bacteroidota bacterium]